VANNNSRAAGGAERGFTLIEALVAFVVLAVGVIGIISLLIMSKNSLHQTAQRTRAISLADAMVERIRVNPSAIAIYNIGANPVGAKPGGGGYLANPATDCAVANCTPDQLATYDLWTWEQALLGASVMVEGDPTGGLIDPQACITFTTQNGMLRSGTLNITVQWHGLEDTEDAVEDGGFACGGADPGEDPHRRQVTVNTIVVDEAEF